MSLFGTILHKIFGAAGAPAPISPASVPTTDATGAAPTLIVPDAASIDAAAPAAPAAPAAAVDVEAVLSKMADGKGGGGNWRSSIVDLLKLLDLDSSLTARKALADELGVHVGADGTAEENIALHKAVMNKVAENGGIVPDSMKG